MAEDKYLGGDNVVLLSEVRLRRQKQGAGSPAAAAAAPAVCAGREIITFVTGGHFEAMVNGVEIPLSARMFVRASVDTPTRFRDVGETPGTLLSVSFPPGIDTAFYRDLAAALPCHATAFPAEGTMGFRRLLVVARRWRVSLADHRAA